MSDRAPAPEPLEPSWRSARINDPDELENHQMPDGTIEDADAVPIDADEPLTADEIEQRQVVEQDDDDDARRD